MARADRPALMPEAVGGPPNADAARRAVEAVWRIESARIVGALARYTGDFGLAEDVAQEALAEALVTWARDGAPSSPVGWLLATARRRAIDAFRRRSARDERYAVLAGQLAEGEFSAGAAGASAPAEDLPWDPDRVDDDVLALMFTACHPVLSPEARVALTLRVVGGLSSEEIARAFLVPTPTVQARITRAKKTIAAARVPFELPPAEERRERLGGVLSVLYVVFTEGSTATEGDGLLRPDLAYEAVRLARMLAALLPAEPEVYGLLALFELTAARFPARTGPDGEAVLLEDQDRRRWDRAAIRRGLAVLGRAAAVGRGLGPYGLQAAIAACHATAPSVAETDWERVVLLYEALGRVAPSPVVELNRAVAVAMASGPGQALELVDDLAVSGRLAGSYLLPSVRGELLARLGRTAEARAELELAARLCRNARERAVLLRKAAALA
ncbi:RNA polymerase sigma factor [Streptacidiphilus sp. P02-A3a]|uniref:RNA polymerase sigma factor n=1 Tax=Streptacidiphilus sp. P02-A3a TaxID=2704468 RepID=UPI001CDB7D06|nr:sigma-70 family RNA polymerase sigma factor [Streptacidiphilus sp. P02-A3a]QMU67405.1 sigma-70 family RNA polymerase sigma factor [Streptacidiphilus sp. P02-A3a]